MPLLIVYLMVLCKNVIYGSSAFFTKKLLASTDTLDVISLRFLMSSAVFALLCAFGVVRLNLKSKSLRTLILCSLFEPVLYFTFETLGISMVSTVMAGVLVALTPIFTCLAEIVFLKEKTNVFQKFALVIGVCGVIFIVINAGSAFGQDRLAGIVMMLLAVLSGTMFFITSRKSSQDFKPMEITCFSSFMGAICFNTVNLVRHAVNGTVGDYFKPYFSMDNLIGFFFLAIVSTIFATGMNNFAISKIQPSRVSAFGGFSTLTTILLGVLVNKESLKYYHIVGAVLIIGGMIGVNRFSGYKSKKEQISKGAL